MLFILLRSTVPIVHVQLFCLRHFLKKKDIIILYHGVTLSIDFCHEKLGFFGDECITINFWTEMESVCALIVSMPSTVRVVK